MKKIMLMSLVALLSMAFTACGDDDDNNGGGNGGKTQAYVEYTINISDEIVNYYDLTATYTTLDGTTVEEKLSTGKVTKRIAKSGTGTDTKPYVVVIGVRNGKTITLDDNTSYKLDCAVSIKGQYSNDGNIVKEHSNPHTMTGAAWKTWMNETHKTWNMISVGPAF